MKAIGMKRKKKEFHWDMGKIWLESEIWTKFEWEIRFVPPPKDPLQWHFQNGKRDLSFVLTLFRPLIFSLLFFL